MHEEQISPLIAFIFNPSYKLYTEGHLRLSGWPKRVLSYSLIFLRLSSLNAE